MRLRGGVALARIIERFHQTLRYEQILLQRVAAWHGCCVSRRLVESRDLALSKLSSFDIEGDRLTEGGVRLLRQDWIKAIPLLLLARLQLCLVVRPLVQVVNGLPRLVRHLLTKLDHLCEDDLLFGSEQADPTDLLEIHAHRVVNAR